VERSQARTNGASIARIGPFEVNLRSGELRRDGEFVTLLEQPLRVLKVLLERPGELVTRDDLGEAYGLPTRSWTSSTALTGEPTDH
jgi:DNA-binding winged helix-turn-helix (wHTH) protein